ncbi:unnamed protein product [Gulo gulo]|uniref:Uncharacterized protein n=1 Tax=Gulo gulo TaxID=48420 RepID=A0A9X9LQ61_GULGU|nr:unnamed protein product [Gulo gulo]
MHFFLLWKNQDGEMSCEAPALWFLKENDAWTYLTYPAIM